MAVVSNFDLRLRPLLEALGLDKLFDASIISAEVGTSCVFDFGLDYSLDQHFVSFMKAFTLPLELAGRLRRCPCTGGGGEAKSGDI